MSRAQSINVRVDLDVTPIDIFEDRKDRWHPSILRVVVMVFEVFSHSSFEHPFDKLRRPVCVVGDSQPPNERICANELVGKDRMGAVGDIQREG